MIRVYILTPQGVIEKPDIAQASEDAKKAGGFIWVDIRSCTEDDIQTVAKTLNLHSVAVESVLHPYSRSHLVEYEDHFHVNFTLVRTARTHVLKPNELHVFVSRHYIVTASKDRSDGLVDQILDYYRETPALAERGSYYALYAISDQLVDSYFPIVEGLDEKIDKLEDDMLANASESNLHHLLRLKRQLFDLRRYLGPQRDIFNELARRDFPFLQENYQLYFQDIYNRMIRVFDVMDTSREVITGTMDLYQSTISNRQNDIMKVLTALAIILGVLSLITGFFGMNFRVFPFFYAKNAMLEVFITMILLAGALVLFFRKLRWL